MDANTTYPPFLLTFEIFNFNTHNCLVDFGVSMNIMPLFVANKINLKWDKIDEQIIKLYINPIHAILNSYMSSYAYHLMVESTNVST